MAQDKYLSPDSKHKIWNAAHLLADAGYLVFPVALSWGQRGDGSRKREKRPLTYAGIGSSLHFGATDDHGVIDRYEKNYRSANAIGILCGRATPGGGYLVGLDLDLAVAHGGDEDGRDNLHRWFNQTGDGGQVQDWLKGAAPDPGTPLWRTGSGGHGLFFRTPQPVMNATNIFAMRPDQRTNVDVRGDGGFVVVPPSAGPDEAYGAYEALRALTGPVAELPASLLALAQRAAGLAEGGGAVVRAGARRSAAAASAVGVAGTAMPLAQLMADAGAGMETVVAGDYHVKPVWTEERCHELLRCISADIDESIWWRVGACLHQMSEGADWGLSLFDRWSRTCPLRYRRGNPRYRWGRWNLGGNRKGAMDVGTLVKLIREHGGGPGATYPTDGRTRVDDLIRQWAAMDNGSKSIALLCINVWSLSQNDWQCVGAELVHNEPNARDAFIRWTAGRWDAAAAWRALTNKGTDLSVYNGSIEALLQKEKNK